MGNCPFSFGCLIFQGLMLLIAKMRLISFLKEKKLERRKDVEEPDYMSLNEIYVEIVPKK